jgi:hydroxyethylthiazole kinase-like uncharacterized protein yjeF
MMSAPPGLPPLPPRPADAHKGSCGRVLVVGGCQGYPGAPLLAARAAFESGAGYVELVVPGCLQAALLEALPEAILHAAGDAHTAALTAAYLPLLDEAADRAEALVLGPGLGAADGEDWLPTWLAALAARRPDLPVVIDADALNRLAAADGMGASTAASILTPHPGEAARLLGLADAAVVQADRADSLAALTARTAAVVVLKGAGTLVGQAGREPWTNPSGNAGLATAGSGDVLAGHLGALAARGLTPWDAARLGVYLHGAAADRFVAAHGEDGLRAGLLCAELSPTMRDYHQEATA